MKGNCEIVSELQKHDTVELQFTNFVKNGLASASFYMSSKSLIHVASSTILFRYLLIVASSILFTYHLLVILFRYLLL